MRVSQADASANRGVVISFHPCEVHEFPWGAAVKKRGGKWTNLLLRPDGQEINVEHLDIVLHENGIEFVAPSRGGTAG